ncbi:hypothetical protein C8J57DRAFT_1392808 [Mycena rebaudengoi]|nr:hypothetical protein C8J57DRAFT_1392808 [Mycena rebaudengoi]
MREAADPERRSSLSMRRSAALLMLAWKAAALVLSLPWRYGASVELEEGLESGGCRKRAPSRLKLKPIEETCKNHAVLGPKVLRRQLSGGSSQNHESAALDGIENQGCSPPDTTSRLESKRSDT